MADQIEIQGMQAEVLYEEPAWIILDAMQLEILYDESAGGPTFPCEPGVRLRHGKYFYDSELTRMNTGD